MNGIRIKRYTVRPDGDMEMAIRTFQKNPLGRVRDRLLLLIVIALVMSAMYPLIRVHANDRNRFARG